MRWLAIVVLAACSSASPTAEQLGKAMFFDQSLSTPPGQACADCHAAQTFFRDPESDHVTSMGVIQGRFGARNAPTVLYAREIPPLHYDAATTRWIGGLFWDGRAESLEDQAASPLLSPLEMNNPDKATVVAHVRAGPHAEAFRELYGPHALDDTERGFAHITEALAAYERTSDFAPFASKYDRFLAGTAELSPAERRGLTVFERSGCASCHPNRPGADGSAPMFTDFSYANVGVPHYDENPFYKLPSSLNPDGPTYVDLGLGKTLGDPAQDGKFRVPTLRNIARTAPYGHNGYFENLPYLIEFLGSRELGSENAPTCSRSPRAPLARCAWPGPELARTIDHSLGHAPLTASEISDLAEFLATLTDEPAR